MTNVNLIHHYETIAETTDRMLAAARANDWETLCAVENECARKIKDLKSIDDPKQLSPEDQQKRMALLKHMLANDAAIPNLTEPWMKHIESLIMSGQQDQQLKSTYR